MPTDFSNYLRGKGYAEHVVFGGLEGLVNSWESVTKGLAQANPAYIMYDEFLNDVDGRRILRECIELASLDEACAIERRVAEADARFRQNTIAVSRCIWGEDNAGKYGYRQRPIGTIIDAHNSSMTVGQRKFANPRHNKSFDRRGGSVFRIKLGAAKVG